MAASRTVKILDVFYRQNGNGVPGCRPRAPPLMRRGEVLTGNRTTARLGHGG
jgi:hypothetical protein